MTTILPITTFDFVLCALLYCLSLFLPTNRHSKVTQGHLAVPGLIRNEDDYCIEKYVTNILLKCIVTNGQRLYEAAKLRGKEVAVFSLSWAICQN